MRLAILLLLCFISTINYGQQFVGINVDTPSVDLDIRTLDINDGSEISVGNLNNSFFLRMFSGREDVPFAAMYWKNTRPLVFGSSEENGSGFTEHLRIRENGNVGIGTDDPFHKFEVRSSDPTVGPIFRIANQSLDHHLTFFPGRDGDPNPFILWREGETLRFATDTTGYEEQMRITSDAKVGIATQDPEHSIHAFDNAHAALKLETNTYSDTTSIILSNGTASSYSDFHLYNRSDQFRIGAKSDLIGDNFEEILTLNNAGNLTVDGSLTSQSLAGSGNRKIVANASGKIIEEPVVNKYISIPPVAFKPTQSSDGYAGSSSFVYGENGTTTTLVAPIYLPDDSVIREFYVHYRDNSSSDNVTFRLMRKSLYLGLTTLHSHTSIGTPNVTNYTSPLLGSVVDNESFVYFIELDVPPGSTWDSGNLALYSARIRVEQ